MRRIRILASLIGMIMLFSVLSAGVAFADHDGGTEWTCDSGPTTDGTPCPEPHRNFDGPAANNAFAPVGSHIAPTDPGRVNGFDPTRSNASTAISNNPLCPLHGVAAP